MSFIDTERRQLAERADGKLARAIGVALPGESQEELDSMAREDEDLARAGLVELRNGEEIWHRHIDDVTLNERRYRIEAEQVVNRWLRGRIERMKIERDSS